MNNKRAISWVAGVLVLGALACNMPSIAGPQPPDDIPTPSASDLDSFGQKLEDLQDGGLAQPFSVTFTQAELNAIANASLDDLAASGEEIPVRDVVLVLDDGLMYSYGTIQIESLQANGLVTIRPSISADQTRLIISVESAEFGPINVDGETIESLRSEVERGLNDLLNTSGGTILLTSLILDDGFLTVEGTPLQ
ncbi:MAG: hypothetical protein GYB68_08375 [Chloroflexi bacterium]|nr:hypothetical protein [Chloroflexota bacterium]